MNKTLLEKACCMLLQFVLSKKKKNKLANMINMTCYLVNRSILIVLEFKTPCEVTSVNTINQIFFIRDNNV
jgi:hypothetical protein